MVQDHCLRASQPRPRNNPTPSVFHITCIPRSLRAGRSAIPRAGSRRAEPLPWQPQDQRPSTRCAGIGRSRIGPFGAGRCKDKRPTAPENAPPESRLIPAARRDFDARWKLSETDSSAAPPAEPEQAEAPLHYPARLGAPLLGGLNGLTGCVAESRAAPTARGAGPSYSRAGTHRD